MFEKPEVEDRFYMCKTDYDHHLTNDSKGAVLYCGIEELRKDRPCVSSCGIVEVSVTNVVVVQEPDYRAEQGDEVFYDGYP